MRFFLSCLLTATVLLPGGVASAASLTVKRLPGSFDTVKWSRDGKNPSTAQASFKVNWNVTEAETGSGQLCLAVRSDLGTPKIALSFAGPSELGRPKGAAQKSEHGDLQWSMQCFGNFDRFKNTTGSNYQFTIDTNRPGGAGVGAYLLSAAKLSSAADDPAAFANAIVAEQEVFPYFPQGCSDARYVDAPRCRARKIIGQFETTLDAQPATGKPNNPLYVNSLGAGGGTFTIEADDGNRDARTMAAKGDFRLVELFNLSSDQDFAFTVRPSDRYRPYKETSKYRSLELELVVAKASISGCSKGDSGRLKLDDGRGQNADRIEISICDIKHLYVNGNQSDDSVTVEVGKPKRRGPRSGV